MAVFLIGWPAWICLQTRELDPHSPCFTGFASLVSLLHFPHCEACNPNIRKQSEMVLCVEIPKLYCP